MFFDSASVSAKSKRPKVHFLQKIVNKLNLYMMVVAL